MDWLSNKRAEESAMTPEEYLHNVRLLVGSLRDTLSDAEVSEIEHLINHDEPAEGLRTLAWIIHDEGKSVSEEIMAAILSLIGDLVSELDLPPGFRNYTGGW